MRKSLNRKVTYPTGKGAFTMERKWANALKADKKLRVKIEVKYDRIEVQSTLMLHIQLEILITQKQFLINNMDFLERICQNIVSVFDEETYYVKFKLEIYTQGDGLGYHGICFDLQNIAITKYSLDTKKLDDNINMWLWDWWNQTCSSENRWNKAELTVYKDGKYEVRTWWDSEFQILLYGEDN
ncbi:hypothetical protein [Flectobacillus roseus]|uniref:Uncharacterized protein n=1 Tax=Flectobacillus roseus TaxID=502259 RepID=A0ABT6Y4E7_9BACT|nr:hypothetical protein [Flectobacillus roseus]MDI9858339.1 hypothetical protein [Flectobacillus roseus]